MTQQRAKFVQNTRSGVVHRLPTRERCNMDQVPRRFRRFASRSDLETISVAAAKKARFCRWCFASPAEIAKVLGL